MGWNDEFIGWIEVDRYFEGRKFDFERNFSGVGMLLGWLWRIFSGVSMFQGMF